jgi:glycolate oxidase iron-sulfur subunit
LKTETDRGKKTRTFQLDLFSRGDGGHYDSLEEVSEEIRRCLKCGTCRSVCPVFCEVLDESYCARGRVALAEALLEGNLDLSPGFTERLSKCLNCKSCIEACPSGIKVDELVLAARAEIFKKGRFPWLKKFIFRHLLKRGRLLPPVSKAIAWVERKILKGLPPSSPYRVLLPLVKVDKDRNLPVFAEKTLMEQLPEVISPEGKPRKRIGFFVGCATNMIYPRVGMAAVRVLVGEGFEVVIPRGQVCCGVPVYTAGDREDARDLAEANIRAFRKHDIDAVVVCCASGGLALKKDYERILGIKPRALGAPVYDISEFLVEFALKPASETGYTEESDTKASGRQRFSARDRCLSPFCLSPDSLPPGLEKVTVTYHDPCHLNRGQAQADAPRKLLKAIPHVEFVEMEESNRCCGGGGTFSFSHYDLATEIGRKKVNYIAASGADIVATSCPSCMMQLEDMLTRNGLPHRVVHVVELLAPYYSPLEVASKALPHTGNPPRRRM